MIKSFSESYKEAGVDIEAGYEAVRLIKDIARRTNISGVLSGVGDFGASFELDLSEFKKPVLVSGTDGVGTKLKIAFLLNEHNTIGIDCVAMCVNDILCSLARPLFFLDYIACSKIVPEKIRSIIEGVAEGCKMAGCALTGGETAEMPGFYAEGEYDIAGFCCGAVDKDKMINKADVKEGAVVLALASSGVHSNGFSLVRRVFTLDGSGAAKTLRDYKSVLGRSLGEELLTPTSIYVKPVLALAKKIKILSLAHITGGGFFENMPRCLPRGFMIRIYKNKLKTPPVFHLIQEAGGITGRDMFNTFNMGVGMIVLLDAQDEAAAVSLLKENGVDAYRIGEVLKSDDGGIEIV